ncbi:hypothetical protein ACLOJK_037152 [Asimina triloba]
MVLNQKAAIETHCQRTTARQQAEPILHCPAGRGPLDQLRKQQEHGPSDHSRIRLSRLQSKAAASIILPNGEACQPVSDGSQDRPTVATRCG